ncbi:MAG: hypothetical protein EAZ80_13765 [Runella slithyformis]|nr:MAG: hypothetical protein EAZ80_13765 [Runella slithyformis]TAF44353.1 MAG: hypothetical protein EAZ63_12515 [Runella slithyformis]
MIADSHFILKPQSVFIPSRDGFLLSALLFEPICSKGVVQISIGTGMKKEFYQHFAQFIAEQNYTVCLWEYRGMGQSRPNDVEVFKKIRYPFKKVWGADNQQVIASFSKY